MVEFKFQCKAKRCKVSPCPACHNRGPCRHCYAGPRKRGCSNLIVFRQGEEEQRSTRPVQSKLIDPRGMVNSKSYLNAPRGDQYIMRETGLSAYAIRKIRHEGRDEIVREARR